MAVTTEDMKDYLKGTDIGVAAGVGIDLPMGLNFGFRFVKGFTISLTILTNLNTKTITFNFQLVINYLEKNNLRHSLG